VALSAAGLPTDRYCFEGFLPAKQKARRERLAELARENRSIVIYESVHRIRDCLADLVDSFGGERAAFIGRELTKLHEQCVQATLAELLHQVDVGDIVCKGEFVIVVAGSSAEPSSFFNEDKMLTELAAHLPPKDVAKIVARISGAKPNVLYQRLLELSAQSRS
jgi:16S rRNA (cytidine1402-2'-O)-methyltransferase